jgi:hypothetical protein
MLDDDGSNRQISNDDYQQKIVNIFKDCKYLQGIPKLFFVQTRHENDSPVVEVDDEDINKSNMFVDADRGDESEGKFNEAAKNGDIL